MRKSAWMTGELNVDIYIRGKNSKKNELKFTYRSHRVANFEAPASAYEESRDTSEEEGLALFSALVGASSNPVAPRIPDN